MKDWDKIRAWRRDRRAEILAKRLAISRDGRKSAGAAIHETLAASFPKLSDGCIGFYWPFRGEVDLTAFLRRLVEGGARAALPVVVEKNEPIEFWSWTPGAKMTLGIWDIPIPETPDRVRPTVLLVPLLGFDGAGYRLGNGGGYYDRTLAVLDPMPLTIGIGYECGRLETIYPQAHDIPLDAIVTEAGCTRIV
jgi:5-formyltetrahydrofolate cyclo-ligase